MPAQRGRRRAQDAALIFSALGDPTRLRLVRRLADRAPLSVTELGSGLAVTRQGVAKHLRVLADAGVVTAKKSGRESLYSLESDALAQARDTLEGIAAGWDRALSRLKNHVEKA